MLDAIANVEIRRTTLEDTYLSEVTIEVIFSTTPFPRIGGVEHSA